MTENVIKKHQCPSCGGNLVVDSSIMYITMGIATCAFLFFGLALGTEVDTLRLKLDRTCPGFVQKDKELTAKKEDI